MRTTFMGGNMDFQQSKTYQNVLSAYQRELSVSTIYDIYSDRAVDDGYIEISQVFTAIQRNEKEHARIFLKRMNNGIVPDTQQNLIESANFELEAGALYRDYASTAEEEGYTDIAALFNGLANIELNHNLTFQTFSNNITLNEVICKPESTLWICIQCGNIMSGECAPKICPVCGFPQGYYKVFPGLVE
jgi:rubrerythrin